VRRLLSLTALVALAGAIVFTQRIEAVGIVATWPVGHQPSSIAIDPTDGRLYVANSGTLMPDNTGTITVVDPASTGTGTLATSGTSDFVAIDPGRRRLYSANVNETLDVFDLSNGTRVATVPVGGGLGVAIDTATDRLYVAGGTADFAMLDGATNTVISRRHVAAGQLWFGVWLDPGLHRVYVSNVDETRPSLWVLDDRDLSVVAEVLIPKPIRWAVAVEPSSHVVYVVGADLTGLGHSSFYTVDPTTLTVTEKTPLTVYPFGLALAPARHRIYLSDLGGNRVLALDDATYAVSETITLPWGPSLPAMHPDGRLYVPAYQGTGADVLAAVDLGPILPVVDTVTLEPAQPRTNDILKATVVAHDGQGRPLGAASLTYQWLRNGVVIGLADPTRPLLDLWRPGFGDRGDTITVRVTATDGGQTSAPKSVSVVVQDTAPLASLTVDTSAPTTNAILVATGYAYDADNDPLSYTFTWKVNGAVRRTTSGSNTSDTFDLGVAGNGDRDDQVTLELVVSDGTLPSATAISTAVVADSSPTAAVTLSNKTPSPKDVVVATASGSDADADPLTFTYTWRVNKKILRTTTTTATTDSFDLTGRANNGDVVNVSVTATDGVFTSSAATDSATVTAKRNR